MYAVDAVAAIAKEGERLKRLPRRHGIVPNLQVIMKELPLDYLKVKRWS